MLLVTVIASEVFLGLSAKLSSPLKNFIVIGVLA